MEKNDPLALSAYVKLARATETVTTNIHRHLADEGMSISQFGVLEALFHLGPLSMCELGRKILRSNANLTTVIDNLEKRGLVCRQRTVEDRRQILVNLSDTGKDLIARIFPRHSRIVADEMGFLDSTELETLSRICKKLGTRHGDSAKDGQDV